MTDFPPENIETAQNILDDILDSSPGPKQDPNKCSECMTVLKKRMVHYLNASILTCTNEDCWRFDLDHPEIEDDIPLQGELNPIDHQRALEAVNVLKVYLTKSQHASSKKHLKYKDSYEADRAFSWCEARRDLLTIEGAIRE